MTHITEYLIKVGFNWEFHMKSPNNIITAIVHGERIEVEIPIGMALEQFKRSVNLHNRVLLQYKLSTHKKYVGIYENRLESSDVFTVNDVATQDEAENPVVTIKNNEDEKL